MRQVLVLPSLRLVSRWHHVVDGRRLDASGSEEIRTEWPMDHHQPPCRPQP